MSTEFRQRMERFRDESLSSWRAVVEDLAQGRTAVTWTALEDMARVLTEAAKRAPHNHTFFADGGGLDLTGACPSHEPGCLELHFDGTTHIVRPASLQLVVPERDPLREWAYFRLETAELAPSGVYKKVTLPHEEVVELRPGQYVDRSGWDDNVLDYDEDGREIRMPKEARLLVRSFRGSLVIVAKGSRYESRAGYRGEHNQLSPAEFRALIEGFIAKLHNEGRYGERP